MHASVAAAPLAAWVKANISYSSVLESVAPLEKELDKVLHLLIGALFSYTDAFQRQTNPWRNHALEFRSCRERWRGWITK